MITQISCGVITEMIKVLEWGHNNHMEILRTQVYFDTLLYILLCIRINLLGIDST